MRAVWKFPLVPGWQTIPATRVVHVGVDPMGDQTAPCVWAEVTDQSRGVDVIAHGTGHEIEHSAEHVGSVVTPVGFVWHVFAHSRWATEVRL